MERQVEDLILKWENLALKKEGLTRHQEECILEGRFAKS
jgi:hypothetical protein